MKSLFILCMTFFLSLQTVSQAFASRIIAIGSPVVEILCALGLEKNLIACSGWDNGEKDIFPILETLPDIGNPFNPNLEKILYLKPDMVVLGSEMGILAKELEKYHIACITVSAYNSKEIIPAIYQLAEIFYCVERAEELEKELLRFGNILQNHRQKIEESKLQRKKGIQFTQINSLYAVSSLSGSTLLEDAGAYNFADVTKNVYPQLSREWLLYYPVDFMVFPVRKNEDEKDRQNLVHCYGSEILRRTHCIFLEEKLTFGLRSTLGSLFLAITLYPEHFENISYLALEEEFFRKIFSVAPTRNEGKQE